MRRAIVIGGGMAGMLAAVAVSHAVDDVVIIERDELPDGPRPRKGLPQARHIHILMAGGADAIEDLLPGSIDRWLAEGAHRHRLTSDMVALSPEGWYRRWRPTHYLVTSSRDLLDHVVRSQTLKNHRIQVLPGRQVTGLLGSSSRVSGIALSHITGTGADEEMTADLVIDASGRASRAATWLADLGITEIPEHTLDTGLTYATRIYRAPSGAESIPVINVMADPRSPGPGQAAALAPIEDKQWIVSLGGTRGGEPTDNPEDFTRFALDLRHPLIGQIISRAHPLTDVAITRSTHNRRRYFEKTGTWPEGFIALGDAIATFNPVYGQGMSVAAQGAQALRRELNRTGDVRSVGLSRRVQRAAAGPVDAAWALATAQDIHYTDAHGQVPTWQDRIVSAFTSRLSRTATGSFFMATAMTDVTTMRKGATRLARPSVLGAALLGPLRPPLTEPPLTERERIVLQLKPDNERQNV
ncbi:2-polyprenyl-6-methoxyphenol hydroxylase-like FAD-dependent oxidoreductase [Streptomyces umbrinus]|uniref:2-polyprenyl-6-methoxyphenol hydroxylase-like FAD-dependent oxidoreductase n=1 Tax=Streptomyces umbrinus TaxID=67370 RepID=A0ABU0SMC2_9ACTN|nr:FAD-dependent oxidoreductase [Streptomyces umbrinus]MDQ1024711.1 2-polyprenyl-6-methoxyphenol hydroxylase-like FAD-dependent oxidoreductase [Streptomyces umbrinus]